MLKDGNLMTRRRLLLLSTATLLRSSARSRVQVVTTAPGALQPQAALDASGILHVLYFSGPPAAGDVFYVRSLNGGSTFFDPIRVNSQPVSAIATGTIRGAQLAVGNGGRVHVAWNGSSKAEPSGSINPDSGKRGAPMLYTRLDDTGAAFEPQRNLMLHSFGLDGGGSIAADPAGNVYVAWHGIGESEAAGKEGEARRAVWLTRSEDDGRSFAPERKAWSNPTGACGCCGMKIFADPAGNVTALYRSATESVHRDIYMLRSEDRGRTFQGKLLDRWEINACPMSSMDIAANTVETVAAWENAGQIWWTRIGGTRAAAPGEGKGRKHPRIAINGSGEVLLVWTEGTGWQKGGSLAWQLYDRGGQPAGDPAHLPGLPAWSFAAAAALPDGNFVIAR
jgi:hypothetical protein